MRFEANAAVPDLVREVPHVAFEVADLASKLAGREILIRPNISDGVHVASIVENGAPIVLLEFTDPNRPGRCQQSNFHDAPLLRFQDAPAIEVHILQSDRTPTGIGEPGVPPIAPAVANAVSAAIGSRIRELPLTPARIAVARKRQVPELKPAARNRVTGGSAS